MGASDEILAEIQRGRVWPVYLLLGEDRGAKEEVVSELKLYLFNSEEEKESGISVFFGDEASVHDVVESLATASIFSPKHLVIVHDFNRIGSIKPLLEYVKAPASNTVLLLFTDKTSVAKSIENAVGKNGKVAIFWPMFQSEGERWLSRYLTNIGIDSEPEAVKHIIEVTGTGKLELKSQAEYIVNYLEEGEVLTFETVKRIIARLYRYTVFDLSNRLFISKAGEIVQVFRWLVRTGEDLVKLEYFCSRELRKILSAQALMGNHYNHNQISQKLRLRKSEASRIKTILETVTKIRIQRVYAGLADLDYTLKSKPKEVALAAFESLLMEMGA
jgi:DNA polymerase III delta subunit